MSRQLCRHVFTQWRVGLRLANLPQDESWWDGTGDLFGCESLHGWPRWPRGWHPNDFEMENPWKPWTSFPGVCGAAGQDWHEPSQRHNVGSQGEVWPFQCLFAAPTAQARPNHVSDFAQHSSSSNRRQGRMWQDMGRSCCQLEQCLCAQWPIYPSYDWAHGLSDAIEASWKLQQVEATPEVGCIGHGWHFLCRV